MKDKIRTLEDILANKEIVLFGAGGYLKEVTELIGRERIVALVDNDRGKQGTTAEGFLIQSPSEAVLRWKQRAAFLISAASCNYEIAKQLVEQWGIPEERIFSFTHLFAENYMYDTEAIVNNQQKIAEAAALMEDEESKEYMQNLVKAKLTRNPLYFRENRNIRKPYFYQGKERKIQVQEQDVILDCGAYIGDTAQLFLQQTDENCRIICFEPLAGNYHKLCAWIHKGQYENKVTAVHALLGDKPGRANIRSPKEHSVQASRSADGAFANEVKVEILDHYIEEEISFIKMDIEGAEAEALLGARKIIERYQPRMVISAYHRTAHLWELPILMRELNPRYKIFCGHQPNAAFEPEFYVTI